MSERKSFVLINDRVRTNAMLAIEQAPANYKVTIAEPGRTIDQNAKMWAMLSDVAKSESEGRQWPPETWKAAFMHFLGHQVAFAEGLDGTGPFPIGFRTSNLTVRQMIDLIECIYAYGNEHGVIWNETERGGFFNEQRAA